MAKKEIFGYPTPKAKPKPMPIDTAKQVPAVEHGGDSKSWQRWLAVGLIGTTLLVGGKLASDAAAQNRPYQDRSPIAYPQHIETTTPEIKQIPPVNIAKGSSPSWSPDGKEVAYVSNGEIWVVGSDNTDRRRLTQIQKKGEYEKGLSDLQWLPDGKNLIFLISGYPAILSLEDGSIKVLYPEQVIDSTGKYPGTNLYGHWLAVLPDGNHFIFQGDDRVGIYNLDGTLHLPIMRKNQIPSYPIDARLLPDNKLLIVPYASPNHPDTVTIIDLGTMQQQELPINRDGTVDLEDGSKIYLSWSDMVVSPSGKWKLEGLNTHALYNKPTITNSESGKKIQSTNEFQGYGGSVEWSTDESKVLFYSSAEGDNSIYVMNLGQE